MWAPAGVTFSMFFINIAFNCLLVSTYGFTGAAYAQSASRIAQFLLLAGAPPSDLSHSRDDTATLTLTLWTQRIPGALCISLGVAKCKHS